MELTKLINSIQAIQVSGNVQRKDVLGITLDSRKVGKNWIFIATKGLISDGHSFIMDALNRGACAVICEAENIPVEMFIHSNAVRILVNDSRTALAELANVYFGNASERMRLIGVTGTNGKTTTTYFIKKILEKAGHKTGLFGTIANYITDEKLDSDFTTPESIELNKLLQKMADANCEYVVMEVSSHALQMKRVHGLKYSAALFTNLTSEHLDYHKSFDNYLSAKKILFANLGEQGFAIVNSDDSNSDKIISDCKGFKTSFGKSEDSEYRISGIEVNLDGTFFTLEHDGKSHQIHTRLIGEFNAYNAAGAFALSHKLGINTEIIRVAIEDTEQVPGRFEVIKGKNKYAVVDYSHTPDSLEKAIINLRKVAGARELITVVGCGGDRDASKRPVMGKLATDLSDKVILTNDNPRSEDPLLIIDQMVDGISVLNYQIELDRKLAIKSAILESSEDAVILIAGKGHEDYQIIGNARNHFSDKETALKYLGELN
ncbi:MAG: UDP-N-acetylmuramoyl-L-alanyl-D-glutamate--2,6-diaminopimelate ligase [Ignavibacteriaceae bacterium]